MVYGLAFYRNEQPIEYGVDGVPAGEHLLVVPAKDTPALEPLLAGRVYQQIIGVPGAGLAGLQGLCQAVGLRSYFPCAVIRIILDSYMLDRGWIESWKPYMQVEGHG